jgi:hypothetical protein
MSETFLRLTFDRHQLCIPLLALNSHPRFPWTVSSWDRLIVLLAAALGRMQMTLQGRLTITEMVKHTGTNQNTLKVRLRELVSAGRIQRHGKARATWYSLG